MPAFKQALHLVVAAGGGERDYAVDGAILTGLRDAADPGAYLNERLQNDLRPTLFLAQLSNLLAGNIAIVHGVTAASRTFMGEESAGIDALRIAQARVASGQIDAILVGGSYSAERPDVLVIHEMGGFLARDAYRPVFRRGATGGFILGSCAAFLMLESEEHAAARGARALARLDRVASDRTRRGAGQRRRQSGRPLAAGGDRGARPASCPAPRASRRSPRRSGTPWRGSRPARRSAPSATWSGTGSRWRRRSGRHSRSPSPPTVAPARSP